MAIRRERRRRDAGDVYPGPEATTARGLFFVRAATSPDARHRDRRAPVGRRGQGQDDRLPGRADRDGRPLPGRRQRRPHGRHRRRGLQAPPDAVGRALPAHHVGHRQRRRRQPGDAHRRAGHARRARHRRRARPGQPQRARDHAVPRGPRPGERGAARRRQGRHDRAGHRARRTATAPGGSGCGWRTCSIAPVLRERLGRALPDKNLLLGAMGAEAVRRSRRWSSRPPAGASGCATTSTTRPGSSRTRSRAASTCCSRAPRARCSTSTTAATRSSRPRTRSPGGACTGGGIGPLQVDEVIGVMKAYSTRVGLRARSRPSCTTRSARASPSAATSSGPSTGRPRRVGWFDAVPAALRGRRQQRQHASCSTSSTSCPASRRSGCASPTRSTAGGSTSGRRAARRSPGRRPIYEDFEGWEEPIHDVRSLADLPENARRYVTALEEHAGVPIVLVSVGPERTQTIERAWRPMRHRPGSRREPRRDRSSCPTRILIVGAGGREHALAWKLAGEPGVNEVIVAPGSAGDRAPSRASAACPASTRSTARRSSRRRGRARPSWSSSGPRRRSPPASPTRCGRPGSRCSGRRGGRPDRDRSKAFCHEVAEAAGVPMARAARSRPTTARRPSRSSASSASAAAASCSRRTASPPARASTVCDDADAGATGARIEAPARPGDRRSSSRSGSTGREASVIALCDGRTAVALPAARDHKRLLRRRRGPEHRRHGRVLAAAGPRRRRGRRDPRTRSIGRSSPSSPAAARRSAAPCTPGLMLTADGPVLLECNARFGDPETQVDPAAPRRRRSGRCCWPPRAAGSRRRGARPPASLPTLPGATVGDRPGRRRATRATPRRGDADRRPRRGRGATGRARLPRRHARPADGAAPDRTAAAS